MGSLTTTPIDLPIKWPQVALAKRIQNGWRFSWVDKSLWGVNSTRKYPVMRYFCIFCTNTLQEVCISDIIEDVNGEVNVDDRKKRLTFHLLMMFIKSEWRHLKKAGLNKSAYAF